MKRRKKKRQGNRSRIETTVEFLGHLHWLLCEMKRFIGWNYLLLWLDTPHSPVSSELYIYSLHKKLIAFLSPS